MYRYVILPDIEDNKNRKKISDILSGYGIRVQKSVFEIEFKTKKELQKLKNELLKFLDKDVDSIKFYSLCANCVNKSFELCNKAEPFERDNIYFF